MGHQYPGRRLKSQDRMAGEVAAREKEQNNRRVRIHWTSTLAAARQKLRKLYPSNEVWRTTRPISLKV